tara:strand:- start:1748 stop:2350 length:603 start_codon:yes stop_codon:yes gene_type:complete
MAKVENLRELDGENGEFWVRNPWDFSKSGQNLSAYERNGVFLNGQGQGPAVFHDIGFLSGADNPGDGRSVTAWDITNDGQPELLVRQAGGGALVIYENRFPRVHWLKLSLRGTRSNRFGIGAKVVCETEDRTIRRELYPHINFLAQSPAMLHLGLGECDRIKRLTIHWPGGGTQVISDIAVDRHISITEGADGPTDIAGP